MEISRIKVCFFALIVAFSGVSVYATPQNYAYTRVGINVNTDEHEVFSDIGVPLYADESYLNGSSYGMTGYAQVYADPHSTIGIRSTVTDTTVDSTGMNAWTSAQTHLFIHVDAPGTIYIPLKATGNLSIPDYPGSGYARTYKASGTLEFYVKYSGEYGSWPILNTADTLSCDIAKFYYNYNEIHEKTFGLETGEFSTASNAITWSIDRVMVANIPSAGDYDIMLRTGLYNSANASSDVMGSAVYESYNSMGFGGDFWDVVYGDTTFYEIDNPCQ